MLAMVMERRRDGCVWRRVVHEEEWMLKKAEVLSSDTNKT